MRFWSVGELRRGRLTDVCRAGAAPVAGRSRGPLFRRVLDVGTTDYSDQVGQQGFAAEASDGLRCRFYPKKRGGLNNKERVDAFTILAGATRKCADGFVQKGQDRGDDIDRAQINIGLPFNVSVNAL